MSREEWLAAEVRALMAMAWAPRPRLGGDPLIAGLKRTEWARRIQRHAVPRTVWIYYQEYM